MRQILVLLIAVGLVVGCGPAPAPTAGPAATQVGEAHAVSATRTAAAPVPTLTAAPSPAPTQPPRATSTPLPTRTPPPVGASLGSFAVVGVASDDGLDIHSGPGLDQPIAGTIPFSGRDVEVFDGSVQAGQSWWAPVRFGEVSGWADSAFLARQVGNVDDAVAARAAEAILALRDHDLEALAGMVHPVKGVTFSPYTYVRPLQGTPGEADLVFSPDQLRSLWSDPTIYHWGTYDGSGEPIDLTFRDYYARFVYDVNFARPQVVGFGETVGQGNTINNIAEVYPDGVTVEYHFEGLDPQLEGMDWRSLRLVLEELDGTWYLVGIVHDQWTI
jgi:hypothetical protein